MAAADLNEIRAALETHFLAGFGADITQENGNTLISESGLILVTQSPEAGATPLVFRNQAFEPTPGDSFVQCLLTFGTSSYLTFGSAASGFNQINGSIEANIFTPLSFGPGANYDLASRVCTLYTREIIKGIQVEPPSGPSVATAAQPASFFQSTVTVPFRVYEEL